MSILNKNDAIRYLREREQDSSRGFLDSWKVGGLISAFVATMYFVGKVFQLSSVKTCCSDASCQLPSEWPADDSIPFVFQFLLPRSPTVFFMNVRTFPMGTRKRPLDFIREKIFIAVSSKYRINTVQNITHRDDRLFTRFMLHSRALLITNTQRQVKYRCWSLLLNVIKF